MNPPKPADRLAELKIGEEQRGSRPFALVTAIIGGLLVIGGGVAAVFLLGSEPEALAVRTARVRSISVDAGTTVLNASGYVTARRQATVSSKTAGQITEIAIEEGMEVAAGQVLARLDSSNLERTLRLAEAQTAAAGKAVLEVEAQLAEQVVGILDPIRHAAEIRVAVQIVELVGVDHTGQQGSKQRRLAARRRGPLLVDDGRHQLRVGADLLANRPSHCRSEYPLRRQSLMWRHDEVFQRVGERVVTDVVHQCRAQEGIHLPHRGPPLGTDLEQTDQHLVGDVKHTEAVPEAGVGGAGKHQVGRTELLDSAELLECGELNHPEQRFGEPDAVPQRIADRVVVGGKQMLERRADGHGRARLL